MVQLRLRSYHFVAEQEARARGQFQAHSNSPQMYSHQLQPSRDSTDASATKPAVPAFLSLPSRIRACRCGEAGRPALLAQRAHVEGLHPRRSACLLPSDHAGVSSDRQFARPAIDQPSSSADSSDAETVLRCQMMVISRRSKERAGLR